VIFPDIKSSSIFDDMYSNDRFKTFAEDILRGLDVGVDGIEFKKETISEFLTEAPLVEARQLEEMKKNIDEDRAGILDTAHFTASLAKENGQYYVRRVITNHVADGKNYTFELKEESDGTQRLMDFIPMIKELDTDDCTYFVDEINRSIHPNTMWDMMSKLMNGKSSGQLVCSSHESNLLSCEIFRTDEIWFAEKRHEDQSTAMYPLSDFKPRNDLDIRKGYLKGRFGAIPFLSKTDDLKWEIGDAVQE
ncbi:MAG: ATP-binding protein, partial [Prevotella sp.]|nr:ATP-binding protein [Prevotella sp.]